MNINCLWVGVILSLITFVVGCVFLFAPDYHIKGEDPYYGLYGLYLALTICGAAGTVLFLVRIFLCGAGIRGRFNVTSNYNNSARIQTQGGFELQTFPSPSQQRLLTTTPQLPIVRPQQPQQAVVNMGGRLYALTPLSTNTASTSSYTPTIIPQHLTQQSSPYNFYTTRK